METLEKLIYDLYKKNARQCTDEEIYNALLIYTKNQLFERGYQDGKKKIYYISAEFLIGKLLSNNLINLGIYDDVAKFLKENGKEIAAIEEVEPEPSLGNGGLGRLAACFLDSIATLGLPGEGIGLNYHLGLFKQLFENRLQKETPNPWIEKHSWLTPAGVSYTVPFRGFSLKSSLYDIDVAGYNNKSIHLHLFDIDLADESMVHDGISFNKKDILHNLTLFLYPDDSDDDGRKLRIFQQYFMVSNAAQFILDEATKKGCNLHDLADYAVIQINDTHPSMIIPELIRLLTERGIAFDEAAEIVSKVCAYTNHTILAEALEKWPMDYLLDVVPHLVPIIEKLDEKIKAKYPQENVAIIDKNNLVHMAHMDIHYGFSINGVAALHTEILKTSELKAFYDIYPEKFNNKTNGITFRRWLMHCNHPLTDYITSLIGDEFKKNATALENLLKYKDDEAVLNKLLEIKTEAKKTCKEFILSNTGVEINENSIYDIQIKRLHEYKRQLLNILHIMYLYNQIKEHPEMSFYPRTFIFGAKAAAGYLRAKETIKLINSVADVVNNDRSINGKLKVVFIEDYRVSNAEIIFAAADVSEQISTASKEASGTGNMKFMLNGAPTLGTMDGANVEIVQEVGAENAFIFGLSSEEVINYENNGGYNPTDIYFNDWELKRVIDQLMDGTYANGDHEMYKNLYNSLLNTQCTDRADTYFILKDFRSYAEAQKRVEEAYRDQQRWSRMAMMNTICSGKFSSDRTIEEYVSDIWKLEKVDVAPLEE